MISAMAVQAFLNRSLSKRNSGIWGWYIARAVWNRMFAIIGWWMFVLIFIKEVLKGLMGFGYN